MYNTIFGHLFKINFFLILLFYFKTNIFCRRLILKKQPKDSKTFEEEKNSEIRNFKIAFAYLLII